MISTISVRIRREIKWIYSWMLLIGTHSNYGEKTQMLLKMNNNFLPYNTPGGGGEGNLSAVQYI